MRNAPAVRAFRCLYDIVKEKRQLRVSFGDGTGGRDLDHGRIESYSALVGPALITKMSDTCLRALLPIDAWFRGQSHFCRELRSLRADRGPGVG
jgi:hypothetical protein